MHQHCGDDDGHDRMTAGAKTLALLALTFVCIMLGLLAWTIRDGFREEMQPDEERLVPVPVEPGPVPGDPFEDAEPIEALPGKPVVNAPDVGPTADPSYVREQLRYGGWSGKKKAQEALREVGSHFIPTFRVQKRADPNDEASASDAPAKLWEFYRNVHGANPPPYKQLRGDCVANALCNCFRLRLPRQFVGASAQQFFNPYRPFAYLIARHFNGARINFGCAKGDRGHGAIVSYALVAGKLNGFIDETTSGLPGYSGAVVDQWSCPRGVPDHQKWLELGRKHLIGECAIMRSADDVKLALQNGYPVDTGFGINFRMQGVVREINGKQKLCAVMVGGSMGHSEAIIGYEDDLFYLWNSWGEDAHGRQPDDSPSGGLWITRNAVERIIQNGEALAFSDVGGFTEPAWDWDDLLWKEGGPHEVPEPSDN